MKKEEKHDKEKKENEEIYKQMTDEEIKKLAEDLYKGLIFTDRHIRTVEDLPMVFIPLALIGKELADKLLENPPGMIYEYLDNAGPRAVNGMPIFMSFRMTSIDDTRRVFECYNKIKEAVASA